MEDPEVIQGKKHAMRTEQFSVIANVQWVLSGPNPVTGATNRNVVVPGVRAVVSF